MPTSDFLVLLQANLPQESSLPWQKLSLAIIPPLLVTLILFKWQLDSKRSLLALSRMVLQLIIVGYTLGYVFQYKTPWVIIFTLSMMILAGSWIALQHIKSNHQAFGQSRKAAYFQVMGSLALAGILTYAYLFTAVLQMTPWLNLKKGIPLAGMIFANGMNAISLASERFFSEYSREKDYLKARNIAFSASLIPITNAMLSIGLVSLPGMMTGNLIAGSSAAEAVKNQIMIMCMIYASAGLSAAFWLKSQEALVRTAAKVKDDK